MESSGAAASSWPNGLAMNGSSNREEMQQTDRPDPANTLAPPPSQDAVVQSAEVGMRAAGEQATIENSAIPMTNGKMDPKPEHEVHSNAQSSMAGHEVRSTGQSNMQAPAPLAVHHGDLGNLDTPARPVVDHGIESNVRDTIDLHETANGLFKVESAPNDQLHDLSLYAALPDPNQLLFGQESAIDAALADPSTPSNALVHVGLPASPTMVEEEPSTHQAYAMLKFPDSYYYVKSMNVMVGRDQHYYNAFKESQKQAKRKAKMQRRAQQSLDDYAREPSHHSQHGGDDDEEDLVGRPAHGLLSTYSDVGGAVSYVDPTDYGFESTTALTQRNRRSKNNSSSNHSIAPRSLHEFEQGDELEGELYADSHGKVHEPQEWAQVTIHPREPGHIEKISREHLIIRFDRDNSRWVMDVIGNMAMHNGDLRRRGETDIVLSHDDEIIIVSVSFRFMLPNDHESEIYYLESSEYANDGEENDLETSPAIQGVSQTIETVESSDEGDSSEEDVPLAQQSKPKKTKDKKSKTKERKLKPVKLKLKNKNAGKKPQKSTEAANAEDKAPKLKGKTPAKSGGKVPATASKAPAQEEGPSESANHNEEGQAANPKDEALPVHSTETPLPEASQTPQTAQPTQASPPAAINLDANSAFAGADPSQLPQKRKGPGRPPKNGLISKRDDAGVKRKLKEYERQGLAPPSMNELLEMVRAEQRQKDAAAKAASRGEAAPDVAMQNVDPRMQNYSTAYASTTPNQPKQSVASGSSAPNDIPTARSTSPRPRRPARSPSPMPARESFTEEQLKKPAITYVFIIDEILQDPALDGQADLQTIYDKIQKRWPYFKYGTTTNGWQSSVRHNLLQSPRFVESGKSGKGKYWKIDFSHELDPKKRKQASPPPPALPRNGLPYQQPFNTAYQQGGQMYHSPYNPGANPVAGPSGSGQLQANGQPANGQYPQPHYGAQSGPSSQQPQPAQPQQPQPFANIVGAILEYQPRFLAPHIGKDTHDQASKQFQDALLYYSDLHAGTTPATEGEVDETQDPYKTLKQIFIQYGQGDTRSSQKSTTNGDSTATAMSTAAPDSNPNTSVPAATAQTANQASPSTTTAATVNTQSAQPAMISANGTPASQTNSLAPPQQSQLPAANGNFATQQPHQAVPPPASDSAASNLSSYPATTTSIPGPPQFSHPAPIAQSRPPSGTQAIYQSSSASAPPPPQPSIAPTQQPISASQVQPVPATSQHQPGQPNGITQFPPRPELGTQTPLAASQLPSNSVVSEQRAPQPEASQRVTSPVVLPTMAATHVQQPPQVTRTNPVGAEQSTTAALHPATAAVIGATPATANSSVHAGMEIGAAKQPNNPLESNVSPVTRSTDLQPPSPGVKRPVEEVDADPEAKRQKTTHESGPGAVADVRPVSAGVKRQAEETAGDHEAKRLKGTNEQGPGAPAP